ncbi:MULTISPECIES: hypothetical protein [Serratia]|uniref:hypothetical protein n=1 Tax=Serratia TaxID=613 RepID=UPI00384CBBDC
MSIRSISVPQCECYFNDGKLKFESIIDYDVPEDIDTTSIYYYIESPEDDSQILFFEYVPRLRATGELSVTGNKNTEIINFLVKKYGNAVYNIIVKVARPQEEEKTVTEQDIQFKDVQTEIDVESVTVLNNIAEVKVHAKNWNDKCMNLSLKTSIDIDEVKFSFDYDVNNLQWIGIATFSTRDGICNAPIKLTLIGDYQESDGCESLPCHTWNYNQELTETVSGGCMNTNYPNGLHILLDQPGNDNNCTVINTDKSGHLVTSYSSIRTGVNKSVYLRVISANGALTQPLLIPDVTDNNQKDADLAAVTDTDNFVAVWSSNAQGGAYRIYIRRFSCSANGAPRAEGPSMQLSQSNGDYVAPRVVYNEVLDKFFVTWISVADKSVQSIYLENDDSLSESSYQSSFIGLVDIGYYSSALDIHNNLTLSISRFSVGDKVLVAYKFAPNIVKIYEYYLETNRPLIRTVADYEVTGIKKFDLAFDDFNKKIKIVYVTGVQGSDVYGDTLSYFGLADNTTRAAKLNLISQVCDNPIIMRSPKLVDGQRHFAVCWQTANYGEYYNFFDSDYSLLQSENEINKGVNTTDSGRIVITDNQIAIVVESTKYETETLSGVGLLYYAENRRDL